MNEIRQILKNSKNIAIVGLSDKLERPSYVVAEYLVSKGYRIFPVNPNIKEWNGLKAYGSLDEIKEPVDIVDIFRKSEEVLPVIDDAIRIKAKTAWMQLGVINYEAAEKAALAGLNVVMDKCIKIEHAKLF